jgi:hypothetical protein
LEAATGFPDPEQCIEYLVELRLCIDPALNLADLAAERDLQRGSGAEARALGDRTARHRCSHNPLTHHR